MVASSDEAQSGPMIETRIATTSDEMEAIHRLRYEVYVEELHRYRGRADQEHRRFAEPEDAWSTVFYAADGDEIIASARITWGGQRFSDRQIAQYQLAPFLAELPHEVLAVGERLAIAPSHRGAGVFAQMGPSMDAHQRALGIQMVFGAFEPHLVSLYCALQRPYADRNINTPDAGYLIPMLSFVEGPEALRGLCDGDRLPRCVEAALATTGTFRSPLLENSEGYLADLLRTFEVIRPRVFEDLNPDEVGACTFHSSIITCAEGDRVLKRGGAARNLFVVLDGALEVRDNGRRVAVLHPGDVFGETAFLLHCPRTYDVDVLHDETRLLAISERTLRHLSTESPTAGAKFFANLATVLSARLASPVA
jgi:GNAT superfamily N-acetyltransferase